MTSKELLELLIGLATFGNTIWITYKAWKELRPGIKQMEADVDKTDAEIDSELAAAAQTTAQGATVSSQLLMQRITELRQDLNNAKEDLENEKRSRREDAAYFRRRFREAEREARDYRLWAAKLVKQVVEAGKVPAEFVPSSGDSETDIPIVRKEDKGDISKQ